MDLLEHEIRVTFRYPVYFSRDVFAPSNPLVLKAAPSAVAPKAARILFVVDSGVDAAHPALRESIGRYCAAHGGALELAAPVLVIPGGEQAKNDPAPTQLILQAIHDASLDRHSYVAAIGGGAVLDVVGYAAAMAHRGIRLIRFPTTVLAQDDSAVGVKNGINAFGQKNYLGTFTPPFAVVNDSSFLTTLSDRDWCGGLSEAVKAALIKDHTFFDYIEERAPALAARDMTAMEHVVRRSAGAPSPAHCHGRGSVRDGQLAAARLRPLGGPQARAADQPSAAPRRSGRNRHRARLHLLASLRLSRRRGLAADPGAAVEARARRSTRPS